MFPKNGKVIHENFHKNSNKVPKNTPHENGQHIAQLERHVPVINKSVE